MSSALLPRAARITLALATILAGACAVTVSATEFDPTHRPAPRRAPEAIPFYSSAQRPACPYAELGRVSLDREWKMSWQKVVRAARQSAHDMGGDALVDVTEGWQVADDGGGRPAARPPELSGVVVRFKDPSCMR